MAIVVRQGGESMTSKEKKRGFLEKKILMWGLVIWSVETDLFKIFKNSCICTLMCTFIYFIINI